MSNNPFNKNTTSYDDFETMKDLNWHCSKCELKSGQAKTWQVWRQEKGITLKTDSKGNNFKRMHCDTCSATTVHRGLETTTIDLSNARARTGIPTKLRKRILKFYNSTDAFTLRTEADNKLEVDHRFPQVRWTDNEEVNSPDMLESEIQEKFMLLTRENNLLKSRNCERCKLTGKRATGYGIPFWYEGDEDWDEELKCKGCFWFEPEKWREEVKKILQQNK